MCTYIESKWQKHCTISVYEKISFYYMVYHKSEWWRENKLVTYSVILAHNNGKFCIIYESRWIIVKKIQCLYRIFSIFNFIEIINNLNTKVLWKQNEKKFTFPVICGILDIHIQEYRWILNTSSIHHCYFIKYIG